MTYSVERHANLDRLQYTKTTQLLHTRPPSSYTFNTSLQRISEWSSHAVVIHGEDWFKSRDHAQRIQPRPWCTCRLGVVDMWTEFTYLLISISYESQPVWHLLVNLCFVKIFSHSYYPVPSCPNFKNWKPSVYIYHMKSRPICLYV